METEFNFNNEPPKMKEVLFGTETFLFETQTELLRKLHWCMDREEFDATLFLPGMSEDITEPGFHTVTWQRKQINCDHCTEPVSCTFEVREVATVPKDEAMYTGEGPMGSLRHAYDRVYYTMEELLVDHLREHRNCMVDGDFESADECYEHIYNYILPAYQAIASTRTKVDTLLDERRLQGLRKMLSKFEQRHTKPRYSTREKMAQVWVAVYYYDRVVAQINEAARREADV